MNIDESGLQQITFLSAMIEHPAFSPDGKKILFIKDFGERTEIWIMNTDGSGQTRLTDSQAWDGWASLVPADAVKAMEKAVEYSPGCLLR